MFSDLVISPSKNESFWEFSGILESFGRILDISKTRILELFSGNSGKNFKPYFRNYVAKQKCDNKQITSVKSNKFCMFEFK